VRWAAEVVLLVPFVRVARRALAAAASDAAAAGMNRGRRVMMKMV